MICGCSEELKSDSNISKEDVNASLTVSAPNTSWGTTVEAIEEYMNSFTLEYKDTTTLIYEGMLSEDFISYGFKEGKLISSMIFIKKNHIDYSELIPLFEGYEIYKEYDGSKGEYINIETNTLGEISIMEIDGEVYYCIGWSEYQESSGNNIITYLTEDNKAISLNSLDWYGAKVVSNTYDSYTNIGKITFDKPLTGIPDKAFFGITKLKSIVIPEEVTTIGVSAFENTSLTSITIPDSVNEIKESAFYCCDKLNYVNISSISEWCQIEFETYYSNPLAHAKELRFNNQIINEFIIPEGTLALNAYSFTMCTNLTSILLPDSITDIGRYCFGDCNNLTSITLPEGIEEIRVDTFFNCKKLSQVILPNSLKTIWHNAFALCINLKNIILPDKLRSIEQGAFSRCSSLKEINIPSSVESIKVDAFGNCDNLHTVYCWPTTPPSNNGKIFGTTENITIYVPQASLNDYKSAKYWSTYASNIKAMPYTPETCTSLKISADDVYGDETSTTIYYEALTNGYFQEQYIEDYLIKETAKSERFDVNMSNTETVERTIEFEYLGKTASTTITQGTYPNYSVSGDWEKDWDINMNPSPKLYKIYKSVWNKGINNSIAWMHIEINNIESFEFYIRSDSENYDYVMVSHLDKGLSTSSTYKSSSVKVHTRGNSNSGTDLSDYKKVTYNNIDKGKHKITIAYLKDGVLSSGKDCGYVLIPKGQ